MISNAKYLTYDNFYSDDKIIVLDIKTEYQTKKIYTISTEKYITSSKIEDYLIEDNIVADNAMLQEDAIDKYILSICKDNLLYIIIINNQLMELLNLTNFKQYKNIQIVNTQYANNNIEKITNFSIEIINSNIKNIIHLKHQVLNSLAIFSKGSIDFNNYITYKIIGYDISETVYLKYQENIPLHYQIYALINHVYYQDPIVYKDYIKLLWKTYKYICKYDNDNTCKMMLHSHINDIRNMQIEQELDPNIATDMLFKKYMYHSSTQDHIIKNNTYIDNIKKVKENLTLKPRSNSAEFEDKPSSDMYVSIITFDDWQDVVNDNNCFGILLNVKCSKIAKLGLCGKNIIVNNYTNTFITKNEVIMGQEHYLKKFKTFDDGQYDQNLLMGSGIGNGNGILPIYINECHWSACKLHIEECISLTVSQNSFSFTKNMLYVYDQALLKVIETICTANSSYKDFHTFINLYITIMEINKLYDIDINTHNLYINNVNNIDKLTLYINKALLNMLMYGECNDNTPFFAYIYEEMVRRELYMFQDKKAKLFKNYRENKIQIINYINNIKNNNLNNIFKLCKSKKLLDKIVLEFKTNNGIIDETSYEQFKCVQNTSSYDYCSNILSLNNSMCNDVIMDNLLLQSFITKNNKKRLQSYETHYKNIILSTVDDIENNNNAIINKLNC
jgi:hypothetical protein